MTENAWSKVPFNKTNPTVFIPNDKVSLNKPIENEQKNRYSLIENEDMDLRSDNPIDHGILAQFTGEEIDDDTDDSNKEPTSKGSTLSTSTISMLNQMNGEEFKAISLLVKTLRANEVSVEELAIWIKDERNHVDTAKTSMEKLNTIKEKNIQQLNSSTVNLNNQLTKQRKIAIETIIQEKTSGLTAIATHSNKAINKLKEATHTIAKDAMINLTNATTSSSKTTQAIQQYDITCKCIVDDEFNRLQLQINNHATEMMEIIDEYKTHLNTTNQVTKKLSDAQAILEREQELTKQEKKQIESERQIITREKEELRAMQQSHAMMTTWFHATKINLSEMSNQLEQFMAENKKDATTTIVQQPSNTTGNITQQGDYLASASALIHSSSCSFSLIASSLVASVLP